jgi:hypothetical protein
LQRAARGSLSTRSLRRGTLILMFFASRLGVLIIPVLPPVLGILGGVVFDVVEALMGLVLLRGKSVSTEQPSRVR